MESQLKCLKCGSNQVTSQKKGFSVGKAAAGVILTGGIGIAAGAIGSEKIRITCLVCGNAWDPKSYSSDQEKNATKNSYSEEIGWKSAWRSTYDKGDYEGAKKIYNQRKEFDHKIQDIHAAYKYARHREKVDSLILYFILGLIFAFVILTFVSK